LQKLGGLQLKRDFATRPNLVTASLPSFRGSTAVPSTLEVFVNNVKQYSNDGPEGAFELQNIRVYSGIGVARIVLRDAQGRETVTEQPFYSSPSLLKPGLYDYSVETGFPRRNQGTSSFDYEGSPAGSASLRYGFKDRLTLEGHAESMKDLVNGGVGAVVSAGGLGVITASAAGSVHKGAAGVQLQGGWEFSRGNFYISASAKRGFGAYADVGIASAEDEQSSYALSSVEQLTLGYGFPDWRSTLGAGIVHSESYDGVESTIIGANAAWKIWNLVFAASPNADASGNYSGTITAYGRVFSGQTAMPAGSYSSSFTSTANSTSRFALAYRNCCSACNNVDSSFSVTSAPFTVSANVMPGCTVAATDLSFGTASLLNSDVDATSPVSVTCTSGLNYAVGLSQGTTTGGMTTTRLMKHASTASTVPYRMYSDASRTANWGNSTSDDVNGTGTGSAVNHIVYGRVPAQAVAPQAGGYSDTVTVTITY
jgi:spore coat protein U-like protein